MARRIANYQDLQDRIADYLNRTDLASQIEDFIYLGERKIFRWYRNANNEKLVTLDMRVTPDVGDPTQVLLDDQLDLPDDYLETLTLQAFTWDGGTPANPTPLPDQVGRPLQRISQTQFQGLRYGDNRNGNSRPGEPQVFCRIRDALFLYPAPEADTYVTWQYYCDLSGLFDTPTSDNNVLKTAPDLYIYAALLEAEPFLKPEDEAYNQITLWRSMYEDAKQEIIEQTEREVFSGSTNEIQSSFGSAGVRSFSTNREGWA